MANNREISQFAGLVTVNDTTNQVSIASTLELSGGGKLGIGTDNPVVRLDVVDSDSPNIALRGSSFPSIRYSGLDGITDAEIYYGAGSGDDLVLNNVNAGPTIFKIGNAEAARFNSSGNFAVGTGGFGGATRFHVRTDSNVAVDQIYVQNRFQGGGSTARIAMGNGSTDYGDGYFAYVGALISGTNQTGNHLIFGTNADAAALTEKMRLTTDGYLRMASGTGGITFNGDTAAANALDDYEEGTGSLFGASPVLTGVTSKAWYIKVGQIVILQGWIRWTGKSGTGNVAITVSPVPGTFGSLSTGAYNAWVPRLQVAQSTGYTGGRATIALNDSGGWMLQPEDNPGTHSTEASFSTSGQLFIMGSYAVD